MRINLHSHEEFLLWIWDRNNKENVFQDKLSEDKKKCYLSFIQLKYKDFEDDFYPKEDYYWQLVLSFGFSSLAKHFFLVSQWTFFREKPCAQWLFTSIQFHKTGLASFHALNNWFLLLLVKSRMSFSDHRHMQVYTCRFQSFWYSWYGLSSETPYVSFYTALVFLCFLRDSPR